MSIMNELQKKIFLEVNDKGTSDKARKENPGMPMLKNAKSDHDSNY